MTWCRCYASASARSFVGRMLLMRAWSLHGLRDHGEKWQARSVGEEAAQHRQAAFPHIFMFPLPKSTYVFPSKRYIAVVGVLLSVYVHACVYACPMVQHRCASHAAIDSLTGIIHYSSVASYNPRLLSLGLYMVAKHWSLARQVRTHPHFGRVVRQRIGFNRLPASCHSARRHATPLR